MHVHFGQRIVRAIGLGLLLCILALRMYITGQMQAAPVGLTNQSKQSSKLDVRMPYMYRQGSAGSARTGKALSWYTPQLTTEDGTFITSNNDVLDRDPLQGQGVSVSNEVRSSINGNPVGANSASTLFQEEVPLIAPVAIERQEGKTDPFWYVYQGYDTGAIGGTHGGSGDPAGGANLYALDIIRSDLAQDGKTVFAATAGTVWFRDDDSGSLLVQSRDDPSIYLLYSHMNKDNIVPTQGNGVEQGERIGTVHDEGDASGSHLHFAHVKWIGDGDPPHALPLGTANWEPLPFTNVCGKSFQADGTTDQYGYDSSRPEVKTEIITCGPDLPGDGVYLYEHTQYAGASQKLTQHAPNLSAELDGKVSSVHVPPGWMVILFAEPNYRGGYLELWWSDNDLTQADGRFSHWNDVFRSAVVAYRACPLIPGRQTNASIATKAGFAANTMTSSSTCLPASGGSGPCSANAIDEFLRSYTSPLAGHGGTFVAAGRQWDVDPRLIVAITGAESSLGKNGLCASQRHNPFGWGGGWPDCWEFNSWSDSINLATRRIRELYFDTWHLYTIHDIGQTYCGSGCTNWESNVRWFYAELGGNPDTNDLTFSACNGTQQPSLRLVSNLTLNPNPPLSPGTQATFDFDIKNAGGATAELDEVFVAANTSTGVNWKAWASAVDIAPGETRHFQSQAPIWPDAGTWHVREIIVYFKDRHYEVFHPNCAFSGNCDFEVQVAATPVPTNTPTPTPSPTPAPQGVKAYRDPNYQGRSEYFKENQHNLHSSGWGDAISSLEVDPGYYTTFFEHPDYRGRCEVFSSDQANLSGSWIGNDEASSLELWTGSAPSDSGGIDGQVTMIPEVVSDNLVAEGWARDASSGPCPGIYEVHLYVDGDYVGDASYDHWNEAEGCHCGWRIEYDTRQFFQGSHIFEFRFVDRSGNVFSDPAKTRRTVVVDHRAPTNPTQVSEEGCNADSNVWQTCRAPSFSWNGADGTGSDVAGYYVYFGSDANGFSRHFVTDASYAPAPVDTGTYYLRVKTKDVAGNTSRWKTLFVFKYDGMPPTNPSFTVEKGGAPNDRWQNDVRAPIFAWSGAHDDHSGLDGYYIYFGPDSDGTSSTLYQPGNSHTFDPITNTDAWAIYYLRVQAKDRAGNVAPWATLFTLRYDGAPPSGTITINSDASQTDTVQVELALSASDEGSGVAKMQFRNNDRHWHDWESYATYWDWQIPSVNRTTHAVSARFRDVAGNASAVTSDDIFLEVQPPRPSSSNFILSASVASIGGNQRSSDNFRMGDTVGEPIAPQPDTPVQQSSSFRIASGFQASFQGESPEPTPTPTPSPTPPPTPPPAPTPVPIYGLTINEGALYTNRADVTLRLIAPWDTEQVMASNDGGFPNAAWQPFVETMDWVLDQHGDAVVERTVFVRYLTPNGIVQWPDTIILDPVEPVSSIRNTATLSHSAARLMGIDVAEDTVPIEVQWTAEDDGSGVHRYIVQVMDHVDDVWRDWRKQTTETSGIFEAQPGHTYSFRTRAQDEAGNWEPLAEATYTITVSAPCTLTGDYDGNGNIGVTDLAFLAGKWRITSGHPAWKDGYDFDGDKEVTVIDLMSLQTHWGETCQE